MKRASDGATGMGMSGSRLRRIADIGLPIAVALYLVSLVESSTTGDSPGLIALGVAAAVVSSAGMVAFVGSAWIAFERRDA